MVPPGDRRRALPDRRHVVADRDRRDHDHAAAGDHRDQAGLGDARRSRASAPRSSTSATASRSTSGQGLLVIRRPWPSMLRTLYNDDERFVETYFSALRPARPTSSATRRAATRDGYFWVIGRIDDVVNVSGHRLSTAEVESAIVAHETVAEAAVIGQFDEQTGQAICAFVTLQGAVEGTGELEEGDPRDRRRADRQVRPPEAHHLGRRSAEDALRQDHAPAAARHRRGPRARRRHDAARPGRRRPPRRGDRARTRMTETRTRPARLRHRAADEAVSSQPRSGRSDLVEARPPAAVGVALEVLEDVGASRTASPGRPRRRRSAAPPRRPRRCASRSRGAACAGSRSR